MQHPFLDVALVGAAGLGAYELWHHHHYGNFGFGNPNNQGGFGGYGNSNNQGGFGGYGTPYGYGPHHGHHHHF
jgi:hypothetical protein